MPPKKKKQQVAGGKKKKKSSSTKSTSSSSSGVSSMSGKSGSKQAAAAAFAGGPKRSAILRRHGVRPHVRLDPSNAVKTVGMLHPVPGTDVSSAKQIIFEFETTGGYYHFPVDPIFVLGKVKIKNSKFKAGPANDSTQDPRAENEKAEYIYLASSPDRGYLNPHLGVASFFSGAEIEVNGLLLKHDLNYQNVYQTFNRSFTSREIRERYAGDMSEILPCLTTEVSTDPGYLLGVEMLNTHTGEHAKGLQGGLDGIFLLSGGTKNLTLLSMQEKKGHINNDMRQFTLLRPGTKIKIRLNRSFPEGRNVGNYNSHAAVDTKSYYCSPDKIKDEEVGSRGYVDAKVELSSVGLVYEKYEFPGLTEEKILGKTVSYTRDAFDTQVYAMTPGLRRFACSFSIPRNTKLAYVAFPLHFQLYFDSTQKKATEYMWTFPENMETLYIKLNGKNLKWEAGLTGLNSTSNAYGSADAQLYYKEMVKNGMLDNKYTDIFPYGNRQRWKDVLVLDFMEENLEENNNLTIELLFEGTALSPTGRLVLCQTVHEESITDRGGQWSVSTPKR